jgi:hypothetical protein
MNASPIWMPRYWDKTVLVDRKNIKSGKNYLYFVVDPKYPYLYSFDGDKVKKECKLTSNGKIYCYQIPMDWLNSEGDVPQEFLSTKDKEYQKYQKTLKINKGR